MTIRPLSLRFALVLGLALAALLAFGRSDTSLAATPVFADGAGACNGSTPCFTTIQEAVNNAGPAPAVVNVFPGTYPENVDLDLMGSAIVGSPGDITLQTVNATGAPTNGTATVNPATGSAIVGFSFVNVTIDGFIASSADIDAIDLEVNDVTLSDITAGSVGNDGVDVFANGNITITNSASNSNGDNGFELDADGNVTITGSTANGNEDSAFEIDVSGDVTITDTVGNDTEFSDSFDIAATNVTLTNVTANGALDGSEGVSIEATGNVTIDRLTATGNDSDGLDIEGNFVGEGELVGNVSVTNSSLRDNGEEGIEHLDLGLSAGATQLANSNVICGNLEGGIEHRADQAFNGEGNWWGAASGPTHPSNAGGTGNEVFDGANPGPDLDGAGTVDFTPWIDSSSGSGLAVVGQASAISFEFTGGAGAVKLQEGPGDETGAAAFTVATSNGTATTSGFLDAGKLNVSLTAATVGTATVTVTGPCGLTGTFAAAVAAAQATPAPSASAFPPTGGSDTGGSLSFPLLIALLALGIPALVGAAAYARRRA